MNIALIDNFDSFTYNLAHYLEEFCDKVTVYRIDKVDFPTLHMYDGLLLSPGPGLPNEFKNLLPLINHFYQSKPILGVCLGLQAIWMQLGGKLINLQNVLHGVTKPCNVIHGFDPLLENIPTIFDSGRYHSWAADVNHKPEDIEILASDFDEIPMIIRHRTYPMYGIQFHPESVLTPVGKQLIKNWINLVQLQKKKGTELS
ncbi:MAG: anthranilate synthase component II [Luteibaculaceae bacterium]